MFFRNGYRVDHPYGFIVATAACLVQASVFGILNSFSVFIHDMSNDASLNNPSQTQLSFGNSVGIGLAPAFGFLAGVLTDRFGPEKVVAFAMLSIFAGLWLAACFADSVIAVALLFSVPAAISTGFMLSPGASATSSWFHRHRALATGITFAGGGLGSCVVPSLAGYWSSKEGWRASFKWMSLFCAVGLFASLFVSFRKQQSREESGETADEYCQRIDDTESLPQVNQKRLGASELFAKVILTRKFAAHFFSFLFFTWAFYSVLYVAVPYASSMGKAGTVYESQGAISNERASTLMTSFGVFQILGSLVMGLVAVKIGNKTTHLLCSLAGAVGALYLAFCRTYAEFSVGLSLVGFATAGIFAVVPPMVAHDYYGPNLSTVIAATFVAGIAGGFSAAPLQSAMQAANYGNYTAGIIIMSACQVVAGVVCFFWIESP